MCSRLCAPARPFLSLSLSLPIRRSRAQHAYIYICMRMHACSSSSTYNVQECGSHFFSSSAPLTVSLSLLLLLSISFLLEVCSACIMHIYACGRKNRFVCCARGHRREKQRSLRAKGWQELYILYKASDHVDVCSPRELGYDFA